MTATCEIHWRRAAKMNFGDHELLADHELRRSELIRVEADRVRFIAATAMARQVLADHLHVAAREVALERRCEVCGAEHGRPRVPGSGLAVSITHAGEVVGVAVTRCGEVGLDVEPLTAHDLGPLADAVLAPDEYAATSGDLLRYWTRKEAVLKATGDGVTGDGGLRELRVSPPDRPPGLRAYPTRPSLDVRMADLACRPGYVASVAVLTVNEVHFTERWHPSTS